MEVPPPLLVRLLADGDAGTRASAAEAAGLLGDAAGSQEILCALAPLLADDDWRVRQSAARTVDRLHSAGVRLFRRGADWRGQTVEELAM